MSQPDLPLSYYELRFVVDGTGGLRRGEDPRGLWHGIFGRGLRAVSCAMDRAECHACPLLFQCPYPELFTGPRPPDAERMRRYDTIPIPHVLHIPSDHPKSLRPGQDLTLGIVLVGSANERLAFVLQAMAEAGAGGLGADRVPLWLASVLQYGPGMDEAWTVAAEGEILGWTEPQAPPTPPPPAFVRVRFISPYKPSGAPSRPRELDIVRLLMAIVRRISLLQYFYTGHQLDAPFDRLKAAAKGTRPRAVDLRRHRSSRYAARHGERLDTSGLIGHIDLALDGIESLWPYLYLGQWLNVGKNASMGFGSYALAPLDGSLG
jgi:hypothetical protein